METPNSLWYILDNTLSYIQNLKKQTNNNNNKKSILTMTIFPFEGRENTSVDYFVNLP